MSEATLWPESIVILVNINGLRPVTSANTHAVQKRTIDQIPPKAKNTGYITARSQTRREPDKLKAAGKRDVRPEDNSRTRVVFLSVRSIEKHHTEPSHFSRWNSKLNVFLERRQLTKREAVTACDEI